MSAPIDLPDRDPPDDPHIASPCIRNCCLNDRDICLGCYRSLEEILAWHTANRSQRLVIIANANQRRVKTDK